MEVCFKDELLTYRPVLRASCSLIGLSVEACFKNERLTSRPECGGLF